MRCREMIKRGCGAPARPSRRRGEGERPRPSTWPCVHPHRARSGNPIISPTSCPRPPFPAKAACNGTLKFGRPRGVVYSRWLGTTRRSCASRSNRHGRWPPSDPTRRRCSDRPRASSRTNCFVKFRSYGSEIRSALASTRGRSPCTASHSPWWPTRRAKMRGTVSQSRHPGPSAATRLGSFDAERLNVNAARFLKTPETRGDDAYRIHLYTPYCALCCQAMHKSILLPNTPRPIHCSVLI